MELVSNQTHHNHNLGSFIHTDCNTTESTPNFCNVRDERVSLQSFSFILRKLCDVGTTSCHASARPMCLLYATHYPSVVQRGELYHRTRIDEFRLEVRYQLTLSVRVKAIQNLTPCTSICTDTASSIVFY